MGLDQVEVVNLINESGGKISLKSYSHYERGEREPKISVAYWIMRVLGLLDKSEEVETIELDIGPGQYKKELIPVWNEDGEIEYYIKSVYTYLTKEEAEAEKKADGAG